MEAPPPEKVPASTQGSRGSFDFLALPQEIRMCVYHLCLVSDTEISLNEGNNAYYVVNYASDDPAYDRTTGGWPNLPGGLYSTPPLPITVNVPANFSYPATSNSNVIFVPPAPIGLANRTVVPQIIPLASVVQPADLSILPIAPKPANTLFSFGTGIYIGPVHSHCCTYLPPSTYKPFASFNARLLRTCKTVYAEAFPILYSKNQFALRLPSAANRLFDRLKERPLAHIIDLRLEVGHLGSILDAGGNSNMWSAMLRQCKQIRRITLRFPDETYWLVSDCIKAITRIAARIADIKKGTEEPTMTIKVLLGGRPYVNLPFMPPDIAGQVRSAMAMKIHARMQVPRGVLIELMGRMSVADYLHLQECTRKGWHFNRTSPENSCDVKDGAWVEAEWVKS